MARYGTTGRFGGSQMEFCGEDDDDLTLAMQERAQAGVEKSRDLLRALDNPPVGFGQVIIWLGECNIQPSQEQFDAARKLPPRTTLREVLRALGATDSQINQASAK